MKRLRIKDIFTPVYVFEDNPTLFTSLKEIGDLQDFINDGNYESLQEDYFVSHSGDKYITKHFYEFANVVLSDNNTTWEELLENPRLYAGIIESICEHFTNIIYQRFGLKWVKIYDALTENYNPLHNYDMTETRTPNLTETRTPNITRGENASTTSSTDVENGVYGFNSTNSNPSTDSTGSQTDTMNRTSTETGTETKKNTGTETLTRSGNIGVTTSQQMLESELELRKYDFYQMIYNDIDTILCLKIY